MDKREVELFENYVKQGGCLIATYDTSRYSGIGEELKISSLIKFLALIMTKRMIATHIGFAIFPHRTVMISTAVIMCFVRVMFIL